MKIWIVMKISNFTPGSQRTNYTTMLSTDRRNWLFALGFTWSDFRYDVALTQQLSKNILAAQGIVLVHYWNYRKVYTCKPLIFIKAAIHRGTFYSGFVGLKARFPIELSHQFNLGILYLIWISQTEFWTENARLTFERCRCIITKNTNNLLRVSRIKISRPLSLRDNWFSSYRYWSVEDMINILNFYVQFVI